MNKSEFIKELSKQTRYNEEKRGGDIYGKNSKCVCSS